MSNLRTCLWTQTGAASLTPKPLLLTAPTILTIDVSRDQIGYHVKLRKKRASPQFAWEKLDRDFASRQYIPVESIAEIEDGA